MEDRIKILIEDKLRHFTAFSSIVKNSIDEVRNLKDVTEEVQNKKIDLILYNVELSYLYNELITIIILAKNLGIKLSGAVLEFSDENKNSLYKRKFSIEGSSIVEAEEGVLDKGRKEFLESDMVKLINKIV